MMRSNQRRCAVTGVLAAALLLGACVTAPPRASLSPELARVTLETRPQDRVEAYRLDGNLVDGLRFDDLTPGAHELRIRHHFETMGSASGGLLGEPQWERCILAVRYGGFRGSEHYTLETERRGFRSVGWLNSSQGEKLADARVIRCGPGV